MIKVSVMQIGIGICSNNNGDTFTEMGNECICVCMHACTWIFMNTCMNIYHVLCHLWWNYLHCACGHLWRTREI